MLTRLRVSGFKSLVDVDVRFGSFTCVAGANGTGKSNLFDAIGFLSALANPENTLVKAASSIRNEEGRTTDIRSLFHHDGEHYAEKMTFEAELIIPEKGIDDLGQQAKAGITFLRYVLHLRYRPVEENYVRGAGLDIVREELSYIRRSDANKHLWFKHSGKNWFNSVVLGRRTAPFFISTSEKPGDEGIGESCSEGGIDNKHQENRIIKRHQDGTGGNPLSHLAANLPRTVLSTCNAAESPTAFLAREEMCSWHLLQLEPSALRRPDDFVAPTHLGVNGAHLAATLHRLAYQRDEDQVYTQLANRLAELIDGVRDIRVDLDEKHEQFTVQMADTSGHFHSARALSDGTLRFLALAVLEMDPDATGVWCLEEPENGIHPARIPTILRLLQDIAMDVDEPQGPDNPLRQVIINTHSPSVVSVVPEDTLVVGEIREGRRNGRKYRFTAFSALAHTWRTQPKQPTSTTKSGAASVMGKGQLLAYLNPIGPTEIVKKRNVTSSHTRRVADREDLQLLLPFPPRETAN